MPEKYAAQRAWKARNREKMLEYKRRWHARHREEVRVKAAAYREHRKPLSKGGSQWAANLVPACLSCNSKKNNKFDIRQILSENERY